MTLSSKQALPILLLSVALSSGVVLPLRSQQTNAIAQEAVSQEAIAQIIGIRFQPTDAGLDLILETANGENIQAFSSTDGNTLILDLVGARLDIGADRYSADNPTEEVSSLIVETLDDQSIRIAIAGIETLPEANLSATGAEFIVNIPSPSAIARDPQPEEPLEASTNIAEIANIRLQPISSGVELVLETTNGDVIQPFSSVDGETLILDLVNARLALPDSDRYSVENPIEEVSSLIVEPLEDGSIRITLVGIEVLPEANLSVTGEEFIVEIPSTAAIARSQDSSITSDSGTLRIGVTGQEENYIAPSSSSATGLDASILETPFSIQILPEELLRDRRVTRLQEALLNVSGVAIQGSDPTRDNDISLRGFTGAPILRDGFRRYGRFQAIPELANLEQVEVIKGAASILYGEIQPGGIINLVSKQPLSEPFYEVELQTGTRGLLYPRVDFSGSLTEDDVLSYRLNSVYSSQQSFDDYTTDYQRFSVAPTLAFRSDRTDLLVSLEYLDERSPAALGLPVINRSVVDVPIERIIGEPGDAIEEEFFSMGYNFEHRFSDNWKIRNAFNYSSYDFAFNVIALPLAFNEATGTSLRVSSSQQGENENYAFLTNIQGEFNTGSVRHHLLFGVDLNQSRDLLSSRGNFTPFFGLDVFNPVYGQLPNLTVGDLPDIGTIDVTTDRVGIYVQDRISFFDDRLQLLAGVRYDTVNQTVDNLTTAVKTTQDLESFTPRLGLLYRITDNASIYGNYSQSFNPNENTTSAGEIIPPEEGEGYEVGIKAELLDGNLVATAAYFDITKQNVSSTDPNNPFFFVATGEQQSRGFEFDLVGELAPGWNLIASYTYTDTEITEDSDTTRIGNRLFGVPEHSASLWTTYQIQSGDLEGLGLGLGFNFVGERAGNLDNDFDLDSYFVTNAAIFYSRDNWRFALNFKNIGNVQYVEFTNGSRSAGNFFGEPFTVIGSVSYEF
ncbi:MAG: TonB-dependent siderophore receptor [Cyanobacteria bacterium SBLK]|nr:TonB-dependent siderophore receptor [Cyanobacteria bacterium SBLK]